MEINTHLSSLLLALGQLPSEQPWQRLLQSPVTCTQMLTGELSVGNPGKLIQRKTKVKTGELFWIFLQRVLSKRLEKMG